MERFVSEVPATYKLFSNAKGLLGLVLLKVFFIFMEFIAANFKDFKDEVCGVYKISFDDKWFYIGSSIRLRRRMCQWRTELLNCAKWCHLSANIQAVIDITSIIKFEILEIVSNPSLVRCKETEHLISNWDNSFLINISPDGENGCYKDLRRIIKPVYQLDKSGNIIETYRNYLLASDFLNVSPVVMKNILKGKKTRTGNADKGYIWKYA